MRPLNPDLSREKLPSARARLVMILVSVVAFSLAASTIAVGQLLLAGVDTRAGDELLHEKDKLLSFVHSALDPATGAPYTDVDKLLAAHLRTNLPDVDETFFSVVAGQPGQRSPHTPAARLDLDHQVVALGADVSAPSSTLVDSSAGPVRATVLPVHVSTDPRPASLVVGQFLRPPRQEAWDIIRLLTIVGTITLLLAAAASWFVAGRILAPVRLVRRTAQQITESDLSRRIPVTGDDDIAALATTFNAMLERLEAAFLGQRAFLHDVGHELRTPLTVVRGHLELIDDDPRERAETLALVIDEIDRMNRLVDDLTILAQSEEPEFLRIGPVNPAHLVIEVVAKARPLGQRRWLIDALCEVPVLADEQRLTQALVQLISNAVEHTRDGDAIAVGSALVGESLRLWVRDTGEGIDSEDAQRIFERSVRGDAAGPRTGSGLGLAIVTTIALAHGGHVEVSSRPGGGSTFSLELPARRVVEQDEVNAAEVTEWSSPASQLDPQQLRGQHADGIGGRISTQEER